MWFVARTGNAKRWAASCCRWRVADGHVTDTVTSDTLSTPPPPPPHTPIALITPPGLPPPHHPPRPVSACPSLLTLYGLGCSVEFQLAFLAVLAKGAACTASSVPARASRTGRLRRLFRSAQDCYQLASGSEN